MNAISRVRDVSTLDGDWNRVNGERVKVTAIPHFVGPFQYAWKRNEVVRVLQKAILPDDAVILRDYGPLGTPVAAVFRKQQRPYGIEVIGDPFDVFAPGVIRHPIRPVIRYVAPRRLQAVCRHACAVTYVTEYALQKRYPASDGAFTTHSSSIQLPDNAFAEKPRDRETFSKEHRLLFVGSFAQTYKGGHILIDALGRHLGERVNWNLTMIGDGRHREEVSQRARRLGVERHVSFLGRLAGAAEVRKELAKADLFVLPSLTEGLPRALIEAMASGLPCIATDVGGIPELLAAEDRVPPGDAAALGTRIHEVIDSPQRMADMSARNLEKARFYRECVLMERRKAFYRHIETETMHWLNGRGLPVTRIG